MLLEFNEFMYYRELGQPLDWTTHTHSSNCSLCNSFDLQRGQAYLKCLHEMVFSSCAVYMRNDTWTGMWIYLSHRWHSANQVIYMSGVHPWTTMYNVYYVDVMLVSIEWTWAHLRCDYALNDSNNLSPCSFYFISFHSVGEWHDEKCMNVPTTWIVMFHGDERLE